MMTIAEIIALNEGQSFDRKNNLVVREVWLIKQLLIKHRL